MRLVNNSGLLKFDEEKKGNEKKNIFPIDSLIVLQFLVNFTFCIVKDPDPNSKSGFETLVLTE